MLSDLLIGPSSTFQHGNRKLHRRQLPRNLSPVFRIMKRHPAPAERNHTLRDPLIRLRIPVPDTSLDQPSQKPMMLNKRLQKPIHLRQLPAPEHLLLRLLLMLSVDRTHRHHTVDIRHTDRIRPLRHKQSSLTHPISTPYLPVKISMVSHHIRGKKPQPLRKHPAVLPKSRHPIRRQMKQNRPHIPRQKTGRINILRNLLLHSNLHTGLDSLHPPLSRRHIPQRQIRIPIQNTRRKLQLNNPAGQIPPRDLTTLLRLPRKIKKLSPRNIPQIHIHKPLNNLPSPPRLKRRIQKRQNHIITHTLHSPPKPRQPPKDHPQNQTNKPPKPSHKPHQHTSEAHHTPLINTHPKLISQVTSAHIRSSSHNPHHHTSEALLSSPTKQSPKLRISINQSIRPTIFFHNYNPKYSKNKFKYYTKTPHPIQNSLYPQSPHDKTQKTHPTHIQRSADATPFPNTPQGNSAPAAIQRSADSPPPPGKPPLPHTPKPERTDCQQGGCMVGTRCVGVSRWSYLAPEAPGGKVLCGHKPQSKPHLSEPGTHQRTWRVMGRPARQAPQTPSMTRRNDRTRHDHAAAPLADCPFVPPFIPQKKSPQAQTPRNSPKTKQHHLLRSFLSSLSSRSARAFSLNVFTLSSLRPCSIP